MSRLSESVVLGGPQVDLGQARDAERLGEFACVVRVVREEAQQDRLARVEPLATRGPDLDGLLQHLGRPTIETAIDDGPRARKGLREFVRPARMVEVLLPARLGRVGPRGRLNPWLPDHVAQPEDADAGHMAERGPDRPALGRGPEAELVIAHPADELDDVALIHRPVSIERADRSRAHALRVAGSDRRADVGLVAEVTVNQTDTACGASPGVSAQRALLASSRRPGYLAAYGFVLINRTPRREPASDKVSA